MSPTKLLLNRAASHWLMMTLVVYCLVGALTISNSIAWGDDWAQYVLHARNLVAGHSYADTGYIFNVDVPDVGPPAYPPGLPLLLFPAMAAFGTNILAFKLLCFACIVLSLPMLVSVLQREFGRSVAVTSILLFALHDQVWALRNAIGSEAPYILVTSLTLWVLIHDRSSGKSAAATCLGSGLGLGALAYAAIACRSIGVSLLLVVLIYGYSHRKALVWLVGVLVSFCLLLWLQKAFVVMPATYGNELKAPSLALLVENIHGYHHALADVFRMPFGLSSIVSVVLILLIVTGIVLTSWRGSIATAAVGRARDRMAHVPASVLYLCVYMCAVLFAAIPPQSRYLWPVLPIVIALMVSAFIALVAYLPRAKSFYRGAVVVLILYYAALHLWARKTPAEGMATCASCQELFAFVRDRLSRDTIVAFAKPRAMALLGERRSWAWSPKYTPNAFVARAASLHTGLVVVGAVGTAWAVSNPAAMTPLDLQSALSGEIVFQNSMFVAIKPGANATRAGQ